MHASRSSLCWLLFRVNYFPRTLKEEYKKEKALLHSQEPPEIPCQEFWGVSLSSLELPAVELLLQRQRVVSKRPPPCLYASSEPV